MTMQNLKINCMPLFTGMFILLSIGLANAQVDHSECIEKKRSAWGEECSQCPIYRDSYVVYLQNTCKEKLDMQVAVQEEDHTWKVFSYSGVAPKDSVRAYACKGKGKYLAWARVAGDTKTLFPSKAEVNAQYKD